MFLDSAKVKLSARDNVHGSDLVLSVDGEPAQSVPQNINTPDEITNIDSALSQYLKNSKIQFSHSHTLKEVVIRDTKIVKRASHKDYGSLASLSSEPDHLITGDKLAACGTVLDCIKVLALGLIYDANTGTGNFYVFNDYSRGQRTPVQVFIKGMPVDVNALNSLNPNDIESVEVFLKDELGLVNSANNSDGALVVNLKKAPETQKISYQQLKDMMPLANEITFTPKGYAPVKTFYLPRYDGPRDTQPGAADIRSTIYWNPNVVTGKTGTSTIQYFNSDGVGTYRAIIEGLDKDGNIGREVYRYTVK